MPKPLGLPGLTFEKVHDAFAKASDADRDALAPGARYRELAAALDDGPDLPPGPLAQPSPYSDQRTALLAAIAHRDARIRELEAEILRLKERRG